MASNFAKNWENFKRELCLNVIIPFPIIACCFVVTWCSKNVFLVNRNGRGAQAIVWRARPPPSYGTAASSSSSSTNKPVTRLEMRMKAAQGIRTRDNVAHSRVYHHNCCWCDRKTWSSHWTEWERKVFSAALLWQRTTHHEYLISRTERFTSILWYRPGMDQKHLIDFCIVSSDLFSDVLHVRVMRDAELSTDHHLVVCSLRLSIPWPNRKSSGSSVTYRIKLEALADRKIRRQFASSISSKFRQLLDAFEDIETE